MSRTNSTTLDLNRSSSDGAIINLRKDGTTVGSIGTVAGNLTIAEAMMSLYDFQAVNRLLVFPVYSNGGGRGSAIDLGLSVVHFQRPLPIRLVST